jgi:hypothetical protein
MVLANADPVLLDQLQDSPQCHNHLETGHSLGQEVTKPDLVVLQQALLDVLDLILDSYAYGRDDFTHRGTTLVGQGLSGDGE